MFQRIFLLGVVLAAPLTAWAQAPQAPAQQAAPQAPAEDASSPWLFVPVFSSNPKLGTAFGGLAAHIRKFDPDSRVSLFGVMYEYTSTHSQIAAVFARTSFGADHHRILAAAVFGNIKNDYEDYLGTGEPLKTDASAASVVSRYLYRLGGDWFIGAQGNAANYQVMGATPEDDLILETLGVRGFSSASLGGAVMHDSRDNEDMPVKGWLLNVNNLAYREALGGEASYDAYRADFRTFWQHGGRHVLAVRQFNWFSHDATAASQASVIIRGYKFGEYLAPYMSSLEIEERLSFGRRWGATVFAGAAHLYGEGPTPLSRHTLPNVGAGLHFVIKPDSKMLVNLEYAQGVEGNRGTYLKLGYAW